MRRGINKIPMCFSCPGDSKELSKKTKCSTYDSNQARTKPCPTRPPTSDNNLLIMKQIKANKPPKCFSDLGDCSRLSKGTTRWNSRNQGNSQLTVLQWLTRVECKLRNQNRPKKGDTKIPATIQNLSRRQVRYRPKQTQPTPSSTMMWVRLSRI